MNVCRFPVAVFWRAWCSIGWTAARRPGGRRTGSEPRRAPSYPDHARLMVVRDGEGRERPVATATTGTSAAPTSWPTSRKSPGRSPAASGGSRSTCRSSPPQKEPGFVRKKITFAAEPGDRVPAWLLIPDGPEAAGAARRRDAPRCSACIRRSRSARTSPPAWAASPTCDYAMELARRGYVAIAPDYPGFGEYKIDVYKMGYASATMKAIWNNKRAVDLLCGLEEVDADRIGVIGHSLGGHNAIFTALFEPRIRAVVSSCGFNAFPSYYKGKIAGWSHKGYMPRLRETL